MPALFNCDTIDPISVVEGVKKQALITPERVKNDCILLDRWVLDTAATMKIDVLETDLAWFQLLDGSAVLDGTAGVHDLTVSNVVFLPPGFKGSLSTAKGATVLYGGVPNADRFDENFGDSLVFRCVNWRAEPALSSVHDARTRIYLVTPTLFGTKAVKGEMIIYPPGTTAALHHHEGAEHFQYIISGSGTAILGDETCPIRAGDTLYNYEYEKHNFISDEKEDLVFVEYFVPAECSTIWVNPDVTCSWSPTGKNIDGGEPSRYIEAHSSAETVNPEGV